SVSGKGGGRGRACRASRPARRCAGGRRGGRSGRKRWPRSGPSRLAAPLLGVALDEGEAEGVDFLEQLLQTFVLSPPCADFREEVFGDVHGAGRAVLLKGQVLSLVQAAAVVTAAGGTPAAVGVGGERSREDGRGRGQFLQPAVEHAPEQGGVLGDAHGGF